MASSSSSSPEITSAPPASGPSQHVVQYSHLTQEEVLEELSSRFILNLPDEELASLERVCFQVEQAHWYYEDFIREQNPSKFPSYTLKTFSEALFRTCPPLQHWAHDHERAYAKFMQYKTRVPVCGAIMLNDTWEKCVLVKGWKSSAGWGFPKGKINEQEPRPRCAAREVLEETGYDLEDQIVPEDVIELSIKEQSISLYIVHGIPEDYPFKTRTRKEISKIAWFKLSDLPTWKRSKAVPGKFYLISPFIGPKFFLSPLKQFIHDRKPRNLPRRLRNSQSVRFAQDVHAPGEEDADHTQASPTASNDHSAQESSSQSSSADNREPETPSPQYSAPQVNLQPHEATPGVDGTLQIMEGVDPHFARLLNSLSLSASASSTNGSAKSMPSASSKSLSPTSSGAHIATSDWSARMPNALMDRSLATSVQSDSSTQHPSSPTATRTVTPALSAPLPRGPIAEASRGAALPTSSPPLAHYSPSSRCATSMGIKQSPQQARARHASRISADISPYLSRPAEIPKQMKYISMLENVVKESDRLSSQFQQQASTLGHAPQTLAADRIPMAPASSAPPSVMFARSNTPVIYSSGPAANRLPPSIPPSARQMLPFDSSYDDPFVVRPRTAFHPPSFPPPLRKPSLNEENRHYMGAGVDTRGPLPLPSTGSFAPQVPFPSSGPAQAALPPMAMRNESGLPPIRPMPPQQFPFTQYGEPVPTPTPGFPSSMTAARSANNAHLLSILNTPSVAARSTPVPSGLMNGVGSR
ncbi:DCP2-domain-containing protein [Laetiporus sulphureus 93-53]|uniref:DCP2-domain-containing protein n=1 Tax=Laetiporus sulphureus 93-53 TaxID=1314785 RepID=A0A165CF12_9APHY|nr:DCP2-domain-containing protein [Laetiporus sulphureus 93-53]KZT02695.1 DCP2-domain-containing protein [Laetiporus sulphureus 93-53]